MTEPGSAANTSGLGIGRRSHRVQVAQVELIPVTGEGSRELEARQNAAIQEILLWLQRQETT